MVGSLFVHCTYLTPEDPERARDNNSGGDDDIDDKLSGDDRILGLTRRLLQHVMVDRFNTEAT